MEPPLFRDDSIIREKMKNKVWIIIAVAFVAIMILAAVLYPKLSEKYSSGGDSEPSNETSENLVEAYDFTVMIQK